MHEAGANFGGNIGAARGGPVAALADTAISDTGRKETTLNAEEFAICIGHADTHHLRGGVDAGERGFHKRAVIVRAQVL